MTDPTDAGDGGENRAEWPVELRGVTESVVTTLGPNGRWNAAALGLHAPGSSSGGDESRGSGRTPVTTRPSVTARTYGRTRTWRNFTKRGEGVVNFTVDPVAFVDAALTVHEVDESTLPSADAWARVEVTQVGKRVEGDTRIRTWVLEPVESRVVAERVPTINRGFGAVIDATVAASRLDVPEFETAELLDRLAYFADVVDRCGGPRERAAFARIDEEVGWRELAAEGSADE